MRCLVRTLTPQGTWQEQGHDVAELSLGRSNQNTVQLPGLLVSARHAVIRGKAGALRLHSDALAGVEVNGTVGVHEQAIKPGDKLQIGDHQIEVITRAGNDLALEVRPGDPGAAAQARAKIDLKSAGLGQRRPAWVLALAVLAIGLALPLASIFLSRTLRDTPAVPSDALWVSGPVSPAHAHFGDNCEQCHAKPFVRVENDACLHCHAAITHHSDDPKIRNVAGFDGRCATCHREHGGSEELIARNPRLCVGCHGDPAFADFPRLAATADFGARHPPFRPLVTIVMAQGQRFADKVTQVAGLKDYSTLLFPHDLHLKAEGVRGPDGVEKLDCAGCHTPDLGQVAFQDLRYGQHCQRCHVLSIEADGGEVKIPHGDNELAWRAVLQAPREAGGPAAAADDRRRPGDVAERGGPMSPEEEAFEVFERRICAKCHELEKDAASGQPRVRDVVLRHSWYTAAKFTHASHRWVACGDCHAAAQSKSSEELLLPSIDGCRTCHAGVASGAGVPSTCIDCHRLHAASQPWQAAATTQGGKDVGLVEQQDQAVEQPAPPP